MVIIAIWLYARGPSEGFDICREIACPLSAAKIGLADSGLGRVTHRHSPCAGHGHARDMHDRSSTNVSGRPSGKGDQQPAQEMNGDRLHGIAPEKLLDQTFSGLVAALYF